MTKNDLRKKYKQLRTHLSIEEVNLKSLAIANQLLTINIWNNFYYHIYLTIPESKEVNTDYILNILAGKDKHIIISKSNFKTLNLENYLLTDSTIIKPNHWNIPEPTDGIIIENSKIDVVFVPLLCFDQNGHRVGYGKGFYDNFLSDCSSQIIKIGLSIFESDDYIDDIYKGDIPLNLCVTPTKIHHFN